MANRYAAPAAQVLDTASARGAQYADVQFWDVYSDNIFVRNSVVRGVGSTATLGYGVRALVDGSWGFAGSDRFDKASLDATAALAVSIAKASARVTNRIRAVQPTEKYVDRYTTAFEIDPRSISLSKRADDLIAAEKAVHVAKNVITGFSLYNGWDTNKEFYSTTGSAIMQRILQTGAAVGAVAIGKDGDVQQRIGPGDFGLFQGGGYEVVHRADLLANAHLYGEEASQLADAPVLPEQTTNLIIHGSVLNLQMHESIGHPLELDRTLGWEANFSGVSWATVDKVGQLRYGSDKMSVYCDNTLPSGFATVGYDDEGVKPQRVTLIENGILRSFESSRDTAAQTGLAQTASVRAQDWASVPMVRMTNIVLAPGEGTLESIIADTNDGVMVSGIRSWSIDDHRLNFQFGPQIAWEIKNGKRGKMYKKPTYTGITPQFWGSMDRVAGESEMVVWGTPNCGKGEPVQSGRTSHACSHARFAGVKVGIKADA
ncbi:MAG: TldD/PmbA family protein [Candidatus Eremiobacteraeota bacterium]|nr:TldD/PmbA family protein [Candidatus Eremiobacteraeota bacterium]